MANLLKGKEVANYINEKSVALVNVLKSKNIVPTLATFRVGDNEADISYEKGIIRRAEDSGVKVINNVFATDTRMDEFAQKLSAANKDDRIHGILVFRPLPKSFDDEFIRNLIKADKDVDGCTDASLAGLFTNNNAGYAPCTAQAAMEILNYYNVDLTGKNVVVIGRSLVVGKPLAMLLLNKNATVTICHSKTIDLPSISKKADIVIAATGQMEMLNKDYFTAKQTVIDVGINWNAAKQKLCGDVLFAEVEPIVENISPVPGGVGAVTNSILINHVISSASRDIDLSTAPQT